MLWSELRLSLLSLLALFCSISAWHRLGDARMVKGKVGLDALNVVVWYGWQSDFASSAGPDALVGWDVAGSLIDLGGLAHSGCLPIRRSFLCSAAILHMVAFGYDKSVTSVGSSLNADLGLANGTGPTLIILGSGIDFSLVGSDIGSEGLKLGRVALDLVLLRFGSYGADGMAWRRVHSVRRGYVQRGSSPGASASSPISVLKSVEGWGGRTILGAFGVVAPHGCVRGAVRLGGARGVE